MPSTVYEFPQGSKRVGAWKAPVEVTVWHSGWRWHLSRAQNDLPSGDVEFQAEVFDTDFPNPSNVAVFSAIGVENLQAILTTLSLGALSRGREFRVVDRTKGRAGLPTWCSPSDE